MINKESRRVPGGSDKKHEYVTVFFSRKELEIVFTCNFSCLRVGFSLSAQHYLCCVKLDVTCDEDLCFSFLPAAEFLLAWLCFIPFNG